MRLSINRSHRKWPYQLTKTGMWSGGSHQLFLILILLINQSKIRDPNGLMWLKLSQWCLLVWFLSLCIHCPFFLLLAPVWIISRLCLCSLMSEEQWTQGFSWWISLMAARTEGGSCKHSWIWPAVEPGCIGGSQSFRLVYWRCFFIGPWELCETQRKS